VLCCAVQNIRDSSKLSDEVKDLLDKMFEIKQDLRIGIEVIHTGIAGAWEHAMS
jgi:hypothetical protein